MCNWRSASPSGSAPHTPTSPSPPAAPPPPSYLLLPSPPSPPLPASPAAVVGVVSASAVTKPLVFQPSCSLLFFLFFFFAALLGVTRLLKQCWHLYQADLTLCPFPPSSLQLLSSSCTPGSITLWLEMLSATHYTKKRKRKKEGKTKTQTIRQKKKKYIQVFPLQQTAHENKHFPASSTWQ